MRDKSLDIFLMLLFGISGVAILMLAWLQPMVVPERILTTFIGSVGLLVAVIRAPRLKSGKDRTDDASVLAEVEVADKT